MDNFNKNLFHTETSRYAYDFLLFLQRFPFTPSNDNPTSVYNYSIIFSRIYAFKPSVKKIRQCYIHRKRVCVRSF